MTLQLAQHLEDASKGRADDKVGQEYQSGSSELKSSEDRSGIEIETEAGSKMRNEAEAGMRVGG